MNNLILPFSSARKLAVIVILVFLVTVCSQRAQLATGDFNLQQASPLSLIVNTPTDVADTNVGDSVCDTDGDFGNGSQCTLRAAIQEANAVAGTETIGFDPNLSGTTILLTSALPELLSSANIVGPGASLLTIQRSMAPATPNFRILNISSGLITVNISGLTLRNGKVDTNGGGILNNGILTITASIITGNSADVGGGIMSGANSRLNIVNSEISGNQTTGGSGAGISSGGALEIRNSTIANNTFGGAIFISGGSTPTTIINSTISGNSTQGGGGGVFYTGNPALTHTIINCTITGNRVDSAGNTGGVGGGILTPGAPFFGATVNLRNTIVAGNFRGSGATPDDIFGVVDPASSFNLIGTGGSGGLSSGTNPNQVGVSNSGLDVLANNGGPTRTHPLLSGSPALDAGDNCVLNDSCSPSAGAALTTDQRGAGFSRSADGNLDGVSRIDIGAFESQSEVKFETAAFNTTESSGEATISVRRTGDLSRAATVDYSTTRIEVPCSSISGSASSRCDFSSALGTLEFAPGEDLKTFTVLISQDSYAEGPETLTLLLGNPRGAELVSPSTAVLTINDDVNEPATNPIDDAGNFVRQHYHDFLNREPDAPGLAFWTNEITSCGTSQQCIEIKRINVSAAFFLSIEFQETGYEAYRMHKAAYGHTTSPNVAVAVPIIRFNEFLFDTQRIGKGVRVGIGDWQTVLESNKTAYAREFSTTDRFIAVFPLNMTAEAYVDKLDNNAGGVLSTFERNQLIAELNAASDLAQARASVLRKVSEDDDLRRLENSRAFVLMQFYGYLRRNPDDSPDTDFRGWEFWLNKLNQFQGNFFEAEMVKAFLSAGEYRQRFGL